ncbi:MAG TPA: hypothetical protein VK136_05930 [Bacillota bacterium]|nr:hypothetical protein [Bacillota bacterium]
MRKLTADEAALIRRIIRERGAFFEADNKRYVITVVEEPQIDAHTAKPTISLSKQRLEQIENDKVKHNFLIDEIVDMMDRGEI